MKISLSQQLGFEIKSFLFYYPKFVFSFKNISPVKGIPVFVFHTIEPDSFESQLLYLKKNSYNPLSVNDFYEYIKNKKTVPPKSILLTIDDARSSVWRLGYPLLKKYDMKATLFILPGLTKEATRCRQNLFDVWEGKAQTSEILNIDKHDNTLCNWQEIKDMHQSGVINIESHSLFHKEVFIGPELMNFVSESTSFDLSNTAVSPYFGFKDIGEDLSLNKYLGYPLFESAPLLLGKPALKVSDDVLKYCHEFYLEGTKNGQNDKKWKQRLRIYLSNLKSKDLFLQANSNPFDQIYAELKTARDLIQQKLGDNSGNHLCLPWTIGSDTTIDVLKKLDMHSCFWGALRRKSINLPGDDPYYVSRIKNDFIWRLPGKDRKSLLSIYGLKVTRRFSSEKIF